MEASVVTHTSQYLRRSWKLVRASRKSQTPQELHTHQKSHRSSLRNSCHSPSLGVFWNTLVWKFARTRESSFTSGDVHVIILRFPTCASGRRGGGAGGGLKKLVDRRIGVWGWTQGSGGTDRVGWFVGSKAGATRYRKFLAFRSRWRY